MAISENHFNFLNKLQCQMAVRLLSCVLRDDETQATQIPLLSILQIR